MSGVARLIWFGLGVAASTAILLLVGAPPSQRISGNNEIVFPANPDIPRSGALTSRYPLIFRRIEVPEQSAWPGAIASSGGVTLLVNRLGGFSRLAGDRFRPAGLADFAVPALPGGGATVLRGIFDMVLRARGGDLDIFLSFAYEGPRPGCTSLAVARASFARDMVTGATLPGGASPVWTTIYTSHPCIDGAGNQISLLGGGAMLLDGDRLTLGIGTFSLNLPEFRDTVAFLQSDANSYGKIVEIDLAAGTVRAVSKGHRDPTGLARTADGTLWSIEHGPRGGDELNRIRQGGNYGWPALTYGSRYGSFHYTDDPDPDRVAQYDVPAFAWVPSIAPSSMLRVDSPKFPAWKGDLLVASLKGARLDRVRVHQGRVLFAEPILIGARIRDIAQTDDGDLLVVPDRLPMVLRIESGLDRIDRNAPEVGFCVTCHRLTGSDTRPATGPSLAGIVGRRVAADPDFRYTEALAAVGGTWSEARIIEFVKAPQRVAFGTSHPDIDMANFRLKEFFEWMRRNGR